MRLRDIEENRKKDEHIKQFEEQYQLLYNSQKALSEIKHNIKYHFLTITTLLNERKFAAAENYIQTELGRFNSVISTGSSVLDTMLNYYSQRVLEKLDIFLKIEVVHNVNISLDSAIISIVLGNALENILPDEKGCILTEFSNNVFTFTLHLYNVECK